MYYIIWQDVCVWVWSVYCTEQYLMRWGEMILSISIHTCQCAIKTLSAAYAPYIITIHSVWVYKYIWGGCSIRYIHSFVRYIHARGINKPKWWPKNILSCASVYLCKRMVSMGARLRHRSNMSLLRFVCKLNTPSVLLHCSLFFVNRSWV